MINPGGIPTISADPDALAAHASAISDTGRAFASTGERVHSTWQRLAPSYRAPEAGQLLTATAPVAAVSATVGSDMGAAGAALKAYAAEVATIKAALDALRAQASAFTADVAAQVAAGTDPRTAEATVDRNNALMDGVATQMAAFMDAQRRCANALRALHGQPPLQVDNGDGKIDPATEFGYTADELRAAGHEDGAVPWGVVESYDRPWYADLGHAVLGLGDAVVDTVTGLGALIGYHDGSWSWSTAGTAWAGLGTFALAVGDYTLMGGALDRTGALPGFHRGQLGETLEAAGKAVIAYDQWSDDPARAAGHATGNVLLAILGTKGAGASLRAAGTAATVARDSGLVAKLGGGLIRAGELIDSVPSLSDLAARAVRRFPGFRVPALATGHIDIPPPGRAVAHPAGSAASHEVRTDPPPQPAPTHDTHPASVDAPGEHHPAAATAVHPEAPDGATHTSDHTAAPVEHGPLGDEGPAIPARPGTRSLGTLPVERVERGSDGLISTVDGRPSKDFVHDLGERRAQEFRDARANGHTSRNQVGEVTAVALDRRTGEVVEASNGNKDSPVEIKNPHPLLKDRLTEMEGRGKTYVANGDGTTDARPRWHPHPDLPLRHAEVKAVNDLIQKRGGGTGSSVFGEIEVNTFAPFGRDGVQSRPYCANCSSLLEGTSAGAGRFTGYPASRANYRPE